MNAAMLRAFLDDIKTQPEDDTARLIFADWLEENGETEADRARGEFIRLQCRWACREYDTDDTDRLRRDLESRLAAHRQSWVGSLGELAANVWFERGLGKLSLTPHQAESLADLRAAPDFVWLEALVISRAYRDEQPLPGDWLSPLLTTLDEEHLTGLSIERTPFSSDEVARLAACSGFARLQGLTLDGAEIGDAGVAALLRSPDLGPLRLLRCSNCGITEASFVQIVHDPGLLHLRSLDLSRNEIPSDAIPSMAEAVFLPRLRLLSLWRNRFTDRALRMLAELDLPALEELDLGFADVTADGVDYLVEADWLRQLRILRLDREQIHGGVQALFRAPLHRLRRLSLSCGSLERAYLPRLVACSNQANLRELYLWDNEYSGDDIAAMIRSWQLPALREIDLAMNRSDDSIAFHLGNWPGLGQLRRLDLSYCELTEPGLRAIIFSPHVHPSAELVLYGNEPSPLLRAEVATLGRSIDLGN